MQTLGPRPRAVTQLFEQPVEVHSILWVLIILLHIFFIPYAFLVKLSHSRGSKETDQVPRIKKSLDALFFEGMVG